MYFKRRGKKLLICSPSEENLISYHSKSKVFSDLCKDKKSNSFKSYVNGLDFRCPIGEAWSRLRKLRGYVPRETCPLNCHGDITEDSGTAEAFANHFASINQMGKTTPLKPEEWKRIKDSIDNIENCSYNRSFTSTELKTGLFSVSNTAEGGDLLSYCLIKALSDNSLCELLDIFN